MVYSNFIVMRRLPTLVFCHDYTLCVHKYSHCANLLWKTSIGRHLAMKSECTMSMQLMLNLPMAQTLVKDGPSGNPQVFQSKLYEYPRNQQVHRAFSLQSLLVLMEIHRPGPAVKLIPGFTSSSWNFLNFYFDSLTCVKGINMAY